MAFNWLRATKALNIHFGRLRFVGTDAIKRGTVAIREFKRALNTATIKV